MRNTSIDLNDTYSHRGAIRQLFCRSFLRYWPSLLIVISLSAIGGLVPFCYAWAGKVVADDVIQVQLLAPTSATVDSFDPTLLHEEQVFQLNDKPVRQGLGDRIEQRPGKSTQQKIYLLAIVGGLMLLIEILRHAAEWVVLQRTVHIGQQVIFRLRQQLHQKLTSLPMQYHDRHSPGRLLTHLFSDVQMSETQIKFLIRELSSQSLKLLVGVGILFYINAHLAFIVLLALPAYAIAYRMVRQRLMRVNTSLRDREGHLNGMIANRVAGFSLVKAFVREQHEAVDFVRHAKSVMRDTVTGQILNATFGAVCGIITGICMVVVLWISIRNVRDGRMTLGDMLLFYTAAGTLFSPIATLTHMAGMTHRLRAIAARINNVLDEPITLDDPVKPVAIPAKSCELRFEHVTMRYQTDRPPALEDVSFTLPACHRLCIMGPSASGKTTLAKLAARLYDAHEGRICFDGIDVKDFQLSDLRRFVSLVNQEPIVFSGSIAENIGYGSDAPSPRSISAAARYAQIEPFIEQLPQQYHTRTQERGLTLSGGQKQRLNLARALHADPKLLVLDDCTSALDAHTEVQIIEALRSVLHQRTAILVSHRVSLAFECDLILMLDHGKVAQFGSPQQLVTEAGPFADLYHQQTDKVQQSLLAISA